MEKIDSLQDIGLKTSGVTSFSYQLGVGKVKAEAFQNNTIIEEIDISSASDIEDGTFIGCDSLLYLTLPPLKVIKNELFDVNSKPPLLSLILLEGVEDLQCSLSGMNYLKPPKFPSTLTSLGPHAIDYCYGIDSLQLQDKFQLSEKQFEKLPNLNRLLFTLKSPEVNNNINLGFDSIQEFAHISANIKTNDIIIGSIFKNCKASEITFLSSNTTYSLAGISEGAFENCINLGKLDLQTCREITIRKNTFKNCTNLLDTKLPSGLQYLCADAFLNANNLALTSLPGNLKGIENTGLQLNIASIPESIEIIGVSAFANSFLVNDTNPKLPNLKKLGHTSFAYSNIQSVQNFGATDIEVPANAFFKCQNLKSFDFSKVKKALRYSFSGIALDSSPTEQIDLSHIQKFEEFSFSYINTPLYLRLAKEAMTSTNFAVNVFKESRLKKVVIPISLDDFNNGLSSLVGQSLKPASYDAKDVVPKYNLIKKELFGCIDDFTLVLNDIVFDKDGSEAQYECLVYEDIDKTILLRCNSSAKDYNMFISSPILPSSITRIRASAFENQTALTSIVLRNVQTVESKAFAKTSLPSVTSEIIRNIGDQAFLGCSRLTEIHLKNATVIGKEAFSGCSKLTSLELNSITTLDDQTFKNCTSLLDVYLPSVTSFKTEPFVGCSKLSSINAPALMNIENQALNTTALNTVTFNSLTSIGTLAFSGCTSLKKVTVPSLISIYESAFSGCSQLKEIDLPITLQSSQQSVFKDCSSLEKITFGGSILPFSNSKMLKDLNSVYKVYILSDSFSNVFEQLKSNGINAIKGTAFYTSDKDGKYPSLIVKSASSIIKIANGLIVDPLTLDVLSSENKYFTLDSTIKTEQIEELSKVRTDAFADTVIKTLSLPSNWRASSWTDRFQMLPFSGNTFKSIVVNDTYNKEKDHDAWSYLFDNCKKDGGQPVIDFNNGQLTSDNGFIDYNDPFQYAEDTITIIGVNDAQANPIEDIPEKAKRVAAKAFSKSSTIKELRISLRDRDSILSIDNWAFYNNSSISSINFGEQSCFYFQDSAFIGSSIQEITLPALSTVIAGYGLNKTYSLKKLSYSNGIERIAPSAMIDCASILDKVIFPGSLKSIGECAFAEFTDQFPRLCALNFGDCPGLSSIERFAFYNSVRTTSNNRLDFPSNIHKISDAAFAYKNRNFDSHNISAVNLTGVKSVGVSAFQYNTFREVNFGNKYFSSVSSIGDFAFDHSLYKYPISIPRTISSIGFNAFRDNVILNPDNVKANILSIDHNYLDTLSVIGISGGIGREISPKYQATNFLGLTPNTVISALDGNSYYKDFMYITVDPRNLASKMLNVCPTYVNIDIYNKKLVSVDHDAISAFIPTYVNGFLPGAFSGCQELIYLSDFYNDNEFILFNNPEKNLFNGCKKLKNARLLSTSTDISEKAFKDCQSITEIWPPINPSSFQYYSLSSIGNQAFSGCASLTKFDIPRGILKIGGSNSFKGCTNLTAINIDLTDFEFQSRMNLPGAHTPGDVVKSKFSSIRADGKCRINFTNAVYTNDGNVKLDHEFLKLNDLGNDISAISGLHFTDPDVRSQSYLNISSVVEVYPYVFDNLNTLANINFLSSENGSLTSIGEYAFYNCTSLNSCSNNKLQSIKTIGQYAFGKCTLLLDMVVNLDTLDSIGKGAFYKTNIHTLTFQTKRLQTSFSEVLAEIKEKIGYQKDINGNYINDRNPLQLPDGCIVKIQFLDGTRELNYLLDDLSLSIIDINRQVPIFIDKTTSSIKPLILVESSELSTIPALVTNTFHANIIGRWK